MKCKQLRPLFLCLLYLLVFIVNKQEVNTVQQIQNSYLHSFLFIKKVDKKSKQTTKTKQRKKNDNNFGVLCLVCFDEIWSNLVNNKMSIVGSR